MKKVNFAISLKLEAYETGFLNGKQGPDQIVTYLLPSSTTRRMFSMCNLLVPQVVFGSDKGLQSKT